VLSKLLGYTKCYLLKKLFTKWLFVDSSMPLVQSFQNHQGLFVSGPILSPYPDSSIINLLPYALDLDSNHFKMTCSVGLQDTLSRHSEQTAIHSLYLCLTILKYINKTEKERKKSS